MTIAVEGKIYQWEKADVMQCVVTTGGAATLEISQDNAPFTPVMTLPLATGELAAQVNLRNARFRFTSITGVLTFKPEAQEVD